MIVCLKFHTAVIINRKNWRITIKLHFENFSIFFKKRTYAHAKTPLLPFLFSSLFNDPSPPILNERTFCITPYHDGSSMKYVTAQKMKFFVKDFSSKCDQIRSFLQILSQLQKKFLIENFIFCAVCTKSNEARLLLYTHICFWATPSPTYNAYIIFFANQPLHNHLIHNACNTSL